MPGSQLLAGSGLQPESKHFGAGKMPAPAQQSLSFPGIGDCVRMPFYVISTEGRNLSA